jgi:hypothetical protein
MEYCLLEGPNQIEVIARGGAIRELGLLRQRYGGRNWRKLKGLATVELPSGRVRRAEVHWYECHGVGRRMMKVKKLVD